MSAAKKIEQMVQANVNTQEAMIAEYNRIKAEQSKHESAARKLKDEADALKAAIAPFVKLNDTVIVGRFEVKLSEKSREGVNLADARKVVSAAFRKEFESLVSESTWTEMKVKVLDQVGELLDMAEGSQS